MIRWTKISLNRRKGEKDENPLRAEAYVKLVTTEQVELKIDEKKIGEKHRQLFVQTLLRGYHD